MICILIYYPFKWRLVDPASSELLLIREWPYVVQAAGWQTLHLGDVQAEPTHHFGIYYEDPLAFFIGKL